MKVLLIVSFSLLVLLSYQESHASDLQISDDETCEILLWKWVSPNTCQINKTFGIGAGGIITIYENIILEILPSVTLENLGTINNFGEIHNNGIIDNQEGTIINNRGKIVNNGSIENNGGTINNNLGIIVNRDHLNVGLYGTLNNDGMIQNMGTIWMEDIESINNVLSPLKQIFFGIPVDEIQCKENLGLILKYDGSPACVKHETKEKLMERGWANLNVNKIRHTVSLPSPPDPMSITITGNDKLPIFTIKRGETKEIGILLEPKIPIISATVALESYFGSAGNCNKIGDDNYCPGRGIVMNLTDTKVTEKKEITLTISIPENMTVGTYAYQIETKTTFDMPSVEKTRTVGNSLRFDIQVK